MTHNNGCFNRWPYVAAYRLNNGTILPNFSHGKPCEYTKSLLGQADKGCIGCRWRQA
jgi:hypothetical protein